MRRSRPPSVEADLSDDWTLDADDLEDLLDDLEDLDPDADNVNLTIEFADPAPLNLQGTPTLNKKSHTHFTTIKFKKDTLRRRIQQTGNLDDLLIEEFELEGSEDLEEAGLIRVIFSRGA